MVETCHVRNGVGRRRAAGFTLIEVLVALVVMSVATYVILSLFSTSVSLGREDRSRRAAYGIAEARLADCAIDPSRYEWPNSDALASGDLVEVKARGNAAANPNGEMSAIPATVPTYPAAADREREFYGKFTSSVYARSIEGAPNVYAITAVVRWTQEGRKQSVSLTTTMPLPAMGGGA